MKKDEIAELIDKAIERGWFVQARNPGKPDHDYRGTISKRLEDDRLRFKGFSGSEEVEGYIRISDITDIGRINSKYCTGCHQNFPVETRTCPLCGESAFFLFNYDAEKA